MLFPFSEYWWFYFSFSVVVLLLLALDLGVFHRKAHAVGFREALLWSFVWIALGLLFGFGLYYYAFGKFQSGSFAELLPGVTAEQGARQVTLEYLTGYVVEKSLAVDNIFVFAVVFTFFGIPPKFQHRILFYGIIGALLFRALFIALSSYLMQYHAAVVFFGLLLILTGIKTFFAPEKAIDPERNIIIRLLRKVLPVTSSIGDGRLFLKDNGIWHATPIFVALVFIEVADIIFAVDSVPAIFAITNEPMLVFASNMFAILGLRSLYFLLAGVLNKFHLLKYGLAVILIFIGFKMVWLNEFYGGKFPIGMSLGIISGILFGTVVLSFAFPKQHQSVP